MSKVLPMHVPTVRAIDPQWTCQRSGDCCTKPREVTMTQEERLEVLRHGPEGIVTHWRDAGHGFVALKAQPCPFYLFNTCTVYEYRPYNCRRFACMRPDVEAEPFEVDGGNLWKRLKKSSVARKLYFKIQKDAQAWAVEHGWKA